MDEEPTAPVGEPRVRLRINVRRLAFLLAIPVLLAIAAETALLLAVAINLTAILLTRVSTLLVLLILTARRTLVALTALLVLAVAVVVLVSHGSTPLFNVQHCSRLLMGAGGPASARG